MIRPLKNLFLPPYEVRVSHPIDRSALPDHPLQEHRLAVDDLAQGHAISMHSLLRHIGVKGSSPVVLFTAVAVETVIKVKLQGDLAAMDLADALRAHLCDHGAVLVVPHDPATSIETAMRSSDTDPTLVSEDS